MFYLQLDKSETRVISTQPINKQLSVLSNDDARSSIQELPISQSPEPARSLPPRDIPANSVSTPEIIISGPESRAINSKNEHEITSKNVDEVIKVDKVEQQKSNAVTECDDSSQVPTHDIPTRVITESEIRSSETDSPETVDSSLQTTDSKMTLSHEESHTEIASGELTKESHSISTVETTQSHGNLIVSAQTFIESFSELGSPLQTTLPFQFDIPNYAITPQNSVDESVLLSEHSTVESAMSEKGNSKSKVTESTLLAVAEKVSKSESNAGIEVISTEITTESSSSTKIHEEVSTTVQVTSSQTSTFETKIENGENGGSSVVITEITSDDDGNPSLEVIQHATTSVIVDEPKLEVRPFDENQHSSQIVAHNDSTDFEVSGSHVHEESSSSSIRIVSYTEKVVSSKIATSEESVETTIETIALPPVHSETILSESKTSESNTVTSEGHVTTSSIVTTSSQTEVSSQLNGEVTSSSVITSSKGGSSAVNYVYTEIVNDGTNGPTSEVAIESGIVRPPLYQAPNHVWSELLQANPTKIETYLSTEVSESKSTSKAVNGN